MATADKLNKLLQTKEAIRQAIAAKGQSVPTTTPFSGYPAKIQAIETSSSATVQISKNTALNGTVNIYYVQPSTGAVTTAAVSTAAISYTVPANSLLVITSSTASYLYHPGNSSYNNSQANSATTHYIAVKVSGTITVGPHPSM